MMSAPSPKKLQHSKWTACQPQQREKHFIVVAVEHDALDAQKVISVTMEAVLSHRQFSLPWRTLGDDSQWLSGWR